MTTWHYDAPVEGILTVTINQQDRPVNALSRAALEELQTLIQQIRKDAAIKGVMFLSSKPGTFLAGADVKELQQLNSSEAAREISQFGQQVFAELESLQEPTIALISGACLGGGLEFSLACNYRIASEESKTLLGLPEVKLGLIPGWGGTVRLPRQVGFITALPLILSGQMLNGVQAKRKNLVHDVVPREALADAGRKVLRKAIDAPHENPETTFFRTRKLPWWKRAAMGLGFVKKMALNKARKSVLAKTHGHYPAPEKAVDVLKRGLISAEEGFAAERDAIAELAAHPVTRESIRLFFLQENAKKSPEEMAEMVNAHPVNNAAVIGAGAMGAGIAELMARKNIWTRLNDLKPEFLSNGLKKIAKSLEKDVRRKRLTALAKRDVLDHLNPVLNHAGFGQCELILEAIVEDLGIKQNLFQELAEVTSTDTVLATNTSSLLVSEIAAKTPYPERVVGLHFFNPPGRMPLVEIIRTEETSTAALSSAISLAKTLGKTMVIVKDGTGFLVNRLLAPYLNEAGYLLTEIRDPLEIERAAIDFGMPMGPLELIDLVGWKVAAHVAVNMFEAFGERMQPAPIWGELNDLAAQTGKGKPELIHKKGKKRFSRKMAQQLKKLRQESGITSRAITREEITQRLIFPLLQEAVICLADKTVSSADDIDTAMVFGAGFAPFRGGPMQYGNSIGWPQIVKQLEELGKEHPRLQPGAALRDYARQHPSKKTDGEQTENEKPAKQTTDSTEAVDSAVDSPGHSSAQSTTSSVPTTSATMPSDDPKPTEG